MLSGSRGIVGVVTLLVVALSASRGGSAQSALTVIPGGQGYGMTTRAAYGCGTNPAVLRVTNLNDSGTGSLRDALSKTGPRVVVFEISGTIALGSDINISEPCLTLAGQTAPSPGITIRNGGLNVYAYHVLIQHIRIRPGDGGPILPQTADHDATIVYGAFGYTPHDIVYDHVSLSWGGGKNSIVWANTATANVTFWRCIVSEALYYAKNVIVSAGQPSSLGMLVYNSGNVSIIGNLFAHNSDRNPEIHEGSAFHFVNNVVYDWGKDQTAYNWATFFYVGGPGVWKATVVGNKYIAGPAPSPFTPLYAIGVWSGDPGSQLYMDDNAIDQTRQAVVPFFNHAPFDPVVGNPPVPLAGITARPSSTIEGFVLANAGARPADRDPVDRRIVDEVTNRTGRVISSQDQVGGWPTLAVNTRPLTLPANPHAQTSSGYTNLEAWLHGYSASVEGNSGTSQQQLLAPAHVRLMRQ
jgi:hypothetical protein